MFVQIDEIIRIYSWTVDYDPNGVDDNHGM